jgi:hypothetical protein
MLSARQFIEAATTALSLITGAFLLALAAKARAQGSAPACDAAGEIASLPSPWAPWKGAPLRVMPVTEKPFQGELSLTGPDGSVAATSRERNGGPPLVISGSPDIKAPATALRRIVPGWRRRPSTQHDAGVSRCTRLPRKESHGLSKRYFLRSRCYGDFVHCYRCLSNLRVQS